jgi:hypothetical protein
MIDNMWYPFKKVIIDIRNYFFVRSVIKKNQGTVEWEKFKLRVDWIGRIYTVVNLPPEVIHSSDTPSDIRPAYVLEESRPINEYLTKLGLQEVIIPKINPIEGTISWLIVYTPFFQRLSFLWIFYRILFLLILIWSQKKIAWVQWAYDKLLIIYRFFEIN